MANRHLLNLSRRSHRALSTTATATADHTSILTYPETRVTTLPNGLRVATESNPASRTATVSVWIDAGSRYETEKTNGVAHFLEHMVFRGTANRPIKRLEVEMENMGGQFKAYTSREHTTYYAKVLGEDVPKALDIFSDMLQNSTFAVKSINRERHVILHEREKSGLQAGSVVFDLLHATAFQYTPLGRTILGPAENIEKITKKDIKNYISTHYAAHRMVIAASGAVKHEDIVEHVKKLFTNLSANPITTTQLVEKEPAVFTGSEVRMRDDDMPAAQFAVAFKGASWTDPDSIALMVIKAMLESCKRSAGGGKRMGPHPDQMMGINELAESMIPFNINYKDTGLFGFYAVAKADCLNDLSFAIMREISKLCYRVGEDDVIRAQNKVKSSLLLCMDGTTPIAEDIGRQLITYGRRIPFAELFARIDAVDAATIERVANKFIFDQDIALAATGPVKLLPDYNWFRDRPFM